ncbi:MAG: hypothetical protein Q8941_01360 [Bacteroidota bacterium]|nr:hypothetical protein [Bacteroidota bacterium]
MRINNFQQWRVLAGLTFLSGCFFLLSCISSEKNSAHSGEKKRDDSNGDTRIFKIIKAAEIKEALLKSKGKKILLNIYPVKHSNNMGKNDLDLLIFYQDENGLKNLSGKINSKAFEIQSGWYVGFLKSKNVPGNKIPPGYHIKIDSAFIHNAGGISISVLPMQAQMEYCILPGEKPVFALSLGDPDSTGKCPPDCCSLLDMARGMDSTGKCPPDCPPYALLLDNTMKTIITRQYKDAQK